MDFAQYGLEELFAAKWSIMEGRYGIVAMFCLQIYEWIAGIQEEVRLIHRASWTSLKWLYLLCRYYPLALWFLVIWAYVGDHSEQTCAHTAYVVHALLAPCQFFSQAVMLMRAYAFSGRNRFVLVLLGTGYILLVGLDIWVFCVKIEIPPSVLYVILDGTGCFPNYGEGVMGLRIGLSMLAAILMDLLSLIVVVVHCIKSRWDIDVSLARYFVSQGLMSFAFVSGVNIVTAIAYFRPPSYHTGLGLPLILILSNIVVSPSLLSLGLVSRTIRYDPGLQSYLTPSRTRHSNRISNPAAVFVYSQ